MATTGIRDVSRNSQRRWLGRAMAITWRSVQTGAGSSLVGAIIGANMARQEQLDEIGVFSLLTAFAIVIGALGLFFGLLGARAADVVGGALSFGLVGAVLDWTNEGLLVGPQASYCLLLGTICGGTLRVWLRSLRWNLRMVISGVRLAGRFLSKRHLGESGYAGTLERRRAGT